MEIASGQAPRFGGEVVGPLSVPSFHDNFADGKLTDPAFVAELRALLEKLTA